MEMCRKSVGNAKQLLPYSEIKKQKSQLSSSAQSLLLTTLLEI